MTSPHVGPATHGQGPLQGGGELRPGPARKGGQRRPQGAAVARKGSNPQGRQSPVRAVTHRGGACEQNRCTTYCLLRSLVEHSCINLKSPAFGYLDEKSIDTGLMKFLGLCPFVLSWYLEFVFASSTSSAPFTTNALPP
ncbi:hypothetical protein BHM03_00055153 [Ensete ventricosum]|nr:hypothetical protein BHM03_00055153 [Ensete ventricosum]